MLEKVLKTAKAAARALAAYWCARNQFFYDQWLPAPGGNFAYTAAIVAEAPSVTAMLSRLQGEIGPLSDHVTRRAHEITMAHP